jgi:peptidoglycan/xylan/chitin deacetylase (PgdA/CDA1 family)
MPKSAKRGDLADPLHGKPRPNGPRGPAFCSAESLEAEGVLAGTLASWRRTRYKMRGGPLGKHEMRARFVCFTVYGLACSCASAEPPAGGSRSVMSTVGAQQPSQPAIEAQSSSEVQSGEPAEPGATPGSEAPPLPALAEPSVDPLAPAAGGAPGAAPLPPGVVVPSDAPTLVVSLTFDDTFAPQLEAATMLEARGLRGTFYVNSPRLHDGSANGASSLYMSVQSALELQARGHEIGGHTLSHPLLSTLPESERIREIAGDRAQLLGLGLAARSVAYPSGDAETASDPALGRSVLDVARTSGYSSGRDTNGFSLNNCNARPEPLPPLDAFRVRSIRSVNDAPEGPGGELLPPDTSDTLLGWMDHAMSCGGGWLPLIFHHLRTDCAAPDAPGSFCFSFAELERLTAALAAGARCPSTDSASCYRISVQTVSGALGATDLPAALPVFGLRNASLERTLASGSTECVQATQGTGGTATLGRSTLARTGTASERMEIVGPFVAAAEIRVSRDFGACSPFASAGQAYDLGVHYLAETGTTPTLRFVTYRLTSDYVWQLWATSEPFVALTPGEWVRQAFRTAPAPVGTIAFSFGLRLESEGAVHVDDFDGAPVAP